MPRISYVSIDHLEVVHLVILAFLTGDEKGKNDDFIDMQVQQLNKNPPHVERMSQVLGTESLNIFVDC